MEADAPVIPDLIIEGHNEEENTKSLKGECPVAIFRSKHAYFIDENY